MSKNEHTRETPASFGLRVTDEVTVAKRYILPRYVVERLKDMSPPYGSQGRAIQVGVELLVRIQYHPIPINPVLKKGVPDAEKHVGMTYKLLPRTIEVIDKFVSTYKTRGVVFEALLTILSRKFIA
jgi:hypothetical protein